MSVEVFIILVTTVACAIIATVEFAAVKAIVWIFKAIKRKVRNKERKTTGNEEKY